MSVPAYAPRSSDNRPDRTLGPVVVLGVIGAILIALGWAIS
jgi:hypothetical protein